MELKSVFRFVWALLATYWINVPVSFSQGYGWAKVLPAGPSNASKSIGVDAAGNVYYTAAFESSIDVDPGAGTTTLVSGLSAYANFLCKLAPDGSFLWADTTNRTLFDSHSASLAVSPSGSCYVTGGLGCQVIKYNTDGTRAWAFPFSNSTTDNYIAYHPSGYIYVVGIFSDTVDFDPGPGVFELSTTTGGYGETFVLKLDTNGTFVWAGRFAGTSNQRPNDVAVDDAGNVYVTGYFTTTVDFDPDTSVVNLNAYGSTTDMFLCRLNADGSFGWVRQIGGPGDEEGWSVLTGPWNSLYVRELRLVTSGTSTSTFWYLIKMDTAGNTIWTRTMNPLGISDITKDNAGNLYLTGGFKGTYDFDTGPGTWSMTSSGLGSMFVMKTDTGLSLQWAQATQGGDSSSCGSAAVAVDAMGTVYTTGTFRRTVDFDPTASVDTFTSFMPFPGTNPRTIYVLKWNPPTLKVEEKNADDKWQLYPNPAKGLVEMATRGSETIGAVQVYNLVGQLVLTDNIKGNRGSIDVSALVAGTYLVKTEQGHRLKLMVE
jgi:hypothetical protein